MPIYEYQCRDCGETSEFLQKFSEGPKRKCPLCGGRLHKLMSLGAFHLKGDGWYVTDYKGKKAASKTPEEKKGDKSKKKEKKKSSSSD